MELLHEPGLADARLADQFQERPASVARLLYRFANQGELSVSADDGQWRAQRACANFQHCADGEGLDRLFLALDAEWLEALQLEDNPRTLQGARCHDHLTRRGSTGQTGGEVHRIAHNRVLSPER